MDFDDVVTRRRMVRRYRSDPVPREVIERIVRAARRAPSAGFSQGQSFVIVTDPDVRRAIADLAGEAGYREAGFDPWVSTAPVLVVLCVSELAYRQRYAEPDKAASDALSTIPYWYLDAGCSLMLLLLAAGNEGLGAGFLGAHRLAGLAGMLGLPSHVRPVGLVTIGHPLPDRRSGSLRRGWRPEAGVIRWEHW